MVQELLNSNPSVALGSCPALCSASQGEEGSFQRKLWDCQHPHCHSQSLRHCAGFAHCLGCTIPISPVWSGDWELCDKPQFLIHHQTVITSPLWGQTESGDGAVTVNTGWELASALQFFRTISPERMLRQPSLCWGTLPFIVCPQRTSDNSAVTVSQVSWSWRDLNKTGDIPLNVFISRQQNSAPAYIWSSK